MLSVFIVEFGQVNTVWKGEVKWKICVFFIFNLLVPLFRLSLFRVMPFFYIIIYGSIHRRCSVKKVFLKIFCNFHRKMSVLESLFIKKRLQHRCFPMNFVKYLRTPFYRTPLGEWFSIWQRV